MQNLQLITNTPRQSKTLLTLGIHAAAFFWHLQDAGKWETAQFKAPAVSDIMVPAWTLAELSAMIGPKWAKPDLWKEDHLQSSATNPNTYPLYFPEKCIVYENAAEAAAAGLIYLLEEGAIFAQDCNERHAKIFKF